MSLQQSNKSPVDTEISLYLHFLLPINHPQYHNKWKKCHLNGFSDTGNIITDKRNRLSPNTIHDLLFLKENNDLIK